MVTPKDQSGQAGQDKAQTNLGSDEVDLGAPLAATVESSPSEKRRTSLLSKDFPQVPGYRIDRPLGKGTYGEVWHAYEEGTNIEVAIKIFTSHSGEKWERFREERLLLARMHGVQGIVQLIDVSTDARALYCIMAFAEKGSLAERLEREGRVCPLSPAEALPLFRQIVEALAYVHTKGIRHCDLKPDNILLDARGRTLIADFGQGCFSRARSSLGTFFYMSPEQADPERQVPDTRWDVYALGALFYFMLTGKYPRDDDQLRQELAGTVDLSHRLRRYREWLTRAPQPRAHRRVVDRALADIIDSCLEIQPPRRFENAGAVLAALDRREHQRRSWPVFVFGTLAAFLMFAFLLCAEYWTTENAVANSRRKLTEELLESDRITARLVANVVEEKLKERIELLKAYPPSERFGAALLRSDQAELEGLLRHLLDEGGRLGSRFTEATVSNNRGVVLAIVQIRDGKAVPAAPPRKYAHYSWRDWYNGGGDQPYNPDKHYPPVDHVHISAPYNSTIDHQLFVSISVPLRPRGQPGAAPVGVLEGAVQLQDIHGWLPETNQKADLGVVLLDQRGYCALHPCQAFEPREGQPAVKFDFSALYAQVNKNRELWGGSLDDARYRDPIDKQPYILGYARMHNQSIGWLAVVQHNREAALRPVEEVRGEIWRSAWRLLPAVVVLLAGLWGWLFWSLRRAEAVHG